jgi:hypothetical protein
MIIIVSASHAIVPDRLGRTPDVHLKQPPASDALIAHLGVCFSGSQWVFVSVGVGLFFGTPTTLGFGTGWSFADTRSYAAMGRFR